MVKNDRNKHISDKIKKFIIEGVRMILKTIFIAVSNSSKSCLFYKTHQILKTRMIDKEKGWKRSVRNIIPIMGGSIEKMIGVDTVLILENNTK